MEKLQIVSGPFAGEEFEIEDGVTIGRTPDNSIQLQDSSVSRKHAQMNITPEGVVLRDLGSANGVFVNDKRVLEHTLSPGDVIKIGATEITYGASRPQKAGPEVILGDEGPAEGDFSPAEELVRAFYERAKAAEGGAGHDAAQRWEKVREAAQRLPRDGARLQLYAALISEALTLTSGGNGVVFGAVSLDPVCVKGKAIEVAVNQGLIRRVIDEASAVLTPSGGSGGAEAGTTEPSAAPGRFPAIAVPLYFKGEVLGALYVDGESMDEQGREMLAALGRAAGQILQSLPQ